MNILTTNNSEVMKLCRSVELSDKKLGSFRSRRVEFMQHFAGPYYGIGTIDGDNWRVPLNLIFSLASTLEPSLAMRRVQAGVSTAEIGLRSFGDRLRLVLDYVSRKIKLAGSIREAVRDSFYGIGITKTYFDGTSALPDVQAISLDGYIIDHRAKLRKPGSFAYEGHRFRMNFEEAMANSDMFDKGARDMLESLKARAFDNRNRASALSGQGYEDDEYDEQIELIELFLPRRNSLVWLAGDLSDVTRYVREFDNNGDESGPFDVLGYNWLNDNPMPVPVMATIFDLYLLENILASKVGRQAQNQKDIGLVDTADPTIARAVKDAVDGDVIHAQGLKGTMLSFGGANEKGYAAVGWFQEWFNRVAGNPDVIGGLTSRAKTLGQEQMLAGNASIRIGDMRGFVYELAENIIRKLARYVWDDPFLRVPLGSKRVGEWDFPLLWEPDEREGRLSDYDFNITAYSRQSDTPEEKYGRLVDLMQKVILPLAQLGLPMGQHLDIDVLTNVAGKLQDITEIEDLWIEGEPIAPTGGQPGMPGEQQEAGRRSPGGQQSNVIGEMAAAAAAASGGGENAFNVEG